jgi:1,4-alpha-glucan branching enzyme
MVIIFMLIHPGSTFLFCGREMGHNNTFSARDRDRERQRQRETERDRERQRREGGREGEREGEREGRETDSVK